jgi:hypothetical protein
VGLIVTVNVAGNPAFLTATVLVCDPPIVIPVVWPGGIKEASTVTVALRS